MSADNQFINPDDKAALLAFANIDLLNQTREMLEKLNYKSHAVYNHDEFSASFAQLEYKLVIIEELFDAATPEQNLTLQRIAAMPMNARRHATFIVMGMNVQSLNSLQAFQMSVHAVVNYTEYSSFAQIIQKVVADNDLFLHAYRDSSRRIAEGKTL